MWRNDYLIIPLTIIMYQLNLRYNIIVGYHNKEWVKKMNIFKEQLKTSKENSMRNKIFSDLTFTVYENWSVFAIYLATLLNYYLIPRDMVGLLEIFIIYLVIIYGIMMDFLSRNSPPHLIVRTLLILTAVHMNAKILGIDLFFVVMNLILS